LFGIKSKIILTEETFYCFTTAVLGDPCSEQGRLFPHTLPQTARQS